MRLSVLAALSFAGAALSAAPAEALLVWQGAATITSASKACQSKINERLTIGVGTVLRSVLRPKGLSDNGDDARLSFVHDGQANFAIFMPGGGASGGYTAFGASHSGVIVANRGGDYKRFALQPKKPKEDTIFITASGVIEDFMFISGCTVTFSAAYSQRPASGS